MKKIFSAALALVCIWFATPAHAALPAGYTQLEYIQSTGTQHIDTGVAVNSNLKTELEMAAMNQVNGHFCGGRKTETAGSGFGIGVIGGKFVFDYEGRITSDVSPTVETRYKIIKDKKNNYIYLNGSLLEETSNSEIAFSSDVHFGLFAIMNSNVSALYTRMYYAKIYNDGTLVRNMIPAKNASGKIGMYDTVNDVFYENKGTGEFIAGPAMGNLVDVSSAYASYGTYVQNNGTFVYTPDASTNDQKGLAFKAPVTDGHKIFISCNYSIEGSDSYRVGLAKNSSLGYFSSDAGVITTGTNKTFSGILTAVADRSGFLGFRTNATSGSLSVKNIQVYDLTAIFGEGNEPDAAGAYAYFNSIKIATTKYNDTKFSPLNTALANAISVVDTVVSNTITQAASIATLQTQKQTRPADDTCPAYKQCLLVEDENGKPHWYEITDPFRDFVTPIIANNVAPTSTTNDTGYTQLEYIRSDGEQYIDTGVYFNADQNFQVIGNVINPDVSTRKVIIGNYQVTGDTFNVLNLELYSNGRARLYMNNGVVDLQEHVFGANTLLSYNVLYNKTNGSVTATYTYDGRTFTSTRNNLNFTGSGSNFLLFRDNRNSYSVIANPLIMGSMAIYQNNNLVRNFIPAKRNSDGAIGMYDTVSKSFFENKGTGTFTAGPVVENDADVPANGTWTATWAADATTGVAAGTVYGEGLCNATEDSTAGKIATDAQMSSANWNTTGSHCWCKIDSIDIEGSDVNTTTNKWVWITAASGCLSNCSYYCANSTKTNTRFRNIMLNTAQ